MDASLVLSLPTTSPSSLTGASGRLAVVIVADGPDVAGSAPVRVAVTVNRCWPGGTVTDAWRTPALTVASDPVVPASRIVNPSTGSSGSKTQVTCTSPDCSCPAVTLAGAGRSSSSGSGVGAVGVGHAPGPPLGAPDGPWLGNPLGLPLGDVDGLADPLLDGLPEGLGAEVENVGCSDGSSSWQCRTQTGGGGGRLGRPASSFATSSTVPGATLGRVRGVAGDHRQAVVVPDDRRDRAVLGHGHAVVGAGDVDEEHAVVEHQRGVAPVGQLDVLAGPRPLRVQPDHLGVAGAGHVDRALERLGTVGVLAADGADVDLVHRAAGDDRHRPGVGRGDGHQRRGCEVGYDEVAGQLRRARHDLVGLSGADLDHDALVGAEQGDALVVAHQHRTRAAVVDVSLVLG